MSDHINAKKGDIAERILLPGDPLRAKYIAENYLENPVCFNEVRGMYGYTGTYKGVPVSVMGTGMGVPSIHIYARELMTEYDVKTLIRIGTGGSYDLSLNVGELVISKGCCYTSSFMDYADLKGTFSAVADHGLVYKAEKLAEKINDLGVKLDALDALSLAEKAGNSKAVNIVLMGRLSKLFDFTEEEWLTAIEQSVPEKFLELNKKAFALGREF